MPYVIEDEDLVRELERRAHARSLTIEELLRREVVDVPEDDESPEAKAERILRELHEKYFSRYPITPETALPSKEEQAELLGFP